MLVYMSEPHLLKVLRRLISITDLSDAANLLTLSLIWVWEEAKKQQVLFAKLQHPHVV